MRCPIPQNLDVQLAKCDIEVNDVLSKVLEQIVRSSNPAKGGAELPWSEVSPEHVRGRLGFPDFESVKKQSSKVLILAARAIKLMGYCEGQHFKNLNCPALATSHKEQSTLVIQTCRALYIPIPKDYPPEKPSKKRSRGQSPSSTQHSPAKVAKVAETALFPIAVAAHTICHLLSSGLENSKENSKEDGNYDKDDKGGGKPKADDNGGGKPKAS